MCICFIFTELYDSVIGSIQDTMWVSIFFPLFLLGHVNFIHEPSLTCLRSFALALLSGWKPLTPYIHLAYSCSSVFSQMSPSPWAFSDHNYTLLHPPCHCPSLFFFFLSFFFSCGTYLTCGTQWNLLIDSVSGSLSVSSCLSASAMGRDSVPFVYWCVSSAALAWHSLGLYRNLLHEWNGHFQMLSCGEQHIPWPIQLTEGPACFM